MRVKTALPALLFALSFFGVHAQTADTMRSQVGDRRIRVLHAGNHGRLGYRNKKAGFVGATGEICV